MATPRAARRAALVLAGVIGLALAPAPAGAEEPTSAAEAAALVAARGHELEVLTEDFNEAREVLAGQQAAAQAAAGAAGPAAPSARRRPLRPPPPWRSTGARSRRSSTARWPSAASPTCGRRRG